jgi:hypothetical protein
MKRWSTRQYLLKKKYACCLYMEKNHKNQTSRKKGVCQFNREEEQLIDKVIKSTR